MNVRPIRLALALTFLAPAACVPKCSPASSPGDVDDDEKRAHEGSPSSGPRLYRDASSVEGGDFTLRSYTGSPELTERGAPRGRSFTFVMDTAKSAYFDGKHSARDPAQPYNSLRRVDVYVPARYEDGTAAPFLIIQDGPGPLEAVARALDNLTVAEDSARKLPAFVAIAVQNGGGDAQGSERGLEYDTLSDRYARFVHHEVLPAVVAHEEIRRVYPQFALTDDPDGRATFGCSSGGAAAFTMGWTRPDLFRRLITYSGTFVAWQSDLVPEAATYPLGAWEYHGGKELVANAATKPLRVFLSVSSEDMGSDATESSHRNWVIGNRRMAAALRSKNYAYRFVYAEGAEHCDTRVLNSTLADTLVWAWAGYDDDGGSGRQPP